MNRLGVTITYLVAHTPLNLCEFRFLAFASKASKNTFVLPVTQHGDRALAIPTGMTADGFGGKTGANV